MVGKQSLLSIWVEHMYMYILKETVMGYYPVIKHRKVTVLSFAHETTYCR